MAATARPRGLIDGVEIEIPPVLTIQPAFGQPHYAMTVAARIATIVKARL